MRITYNTSFSSSNNLSKNDRFVEVRLLNTYKEILNKEYSEYNEKARTLKREDGFFINLDDGNIYLNAFMANPYSGGWRAEPIFVYDSLESHLRFSNDAINSQWTDIYLHTKFLIKTQSSEAWFSFQFIPKDPIFLSKNFAIISAENANMIQSTSEENKINNDLLSKILNEKGTENYQTVATLGEHRENCFIVYDISIEEALELAAEFNQESILVNYNSTLKIIKCANKEVVVSKEY